MEVVRHCVEPAATSKVLMVLRARPRTSVVGVGKSLVCVCDGGVSVSVSVSVCDTNTPWGGSHLAVMVCVNACALTAVGCCGGICCECAMQSSPFVTYLLRSIHM